VIVTTFEHTKNPTPLNVRNESWPDFVGFIERNGHARCEDKEQQALFGLFSLKAGTVRRNTNVEAVFGWALDLDKMSQAEIDAVLERLVDNDLAFLAYSTHSHTEAKPKLRIVGPLTRPVAGKDWRGTWRAIVDKYSPGADEQCKDAARIFYYPSAEPGAPTVLFANDGQPLEPPAVAPAAPQVDLDARSVIDGGFRLDRAPAGTSPFAYAEQLCREMPAAVQGQSGSVALLRVARALVWGLELDRTQAISLIGELFNPRCDPPWTEAEIEHKVDDASSETGAPYVRGALKPFPVTDFDHLPILVQNNGRYWLRQPDGDDYSRRCVRDDLPIVVRKHYPVGTHEFHDDDTEIPKIQDLSKWSHPVREIVGCYYVAKTTYDPKTEVLVQGLRIDPELTPRFDADVEAFLRAYAGDDVENLKKWISGCRSDRLTAPSRALAIVGPKSVGKSLFAHGLARIWDRDAVPADVLCARFNGALEFCPIVLADEELPPDLTGEAFRTVIAARRHSIEPKGKERHMLHGCVRMVVTANSLEKLHLAGAKGRDDVAAIADRFFLVHVDDVRAAACLEAQRPLLGDDGSTVDVARMAAHFLYVMANVEPERGRFIGAAGDGGAMSVTLAAETERCPELFDVLRAFFHEGWGAGYKPTSAGIPRRGEVTPEAKRNAPIVVQDGRVFARVAVLGQIVGREQREVVGHLKPFTLQARVPVTLGGVTFDAAELDPFTLAKSLDLDVEKTAATLATDTADRLTS
jgi:hypothetical protein